MRVVIVNYDTRREIDTGNIDILTRWLADTIPLYLSVNHSYPAAKLELWPETQAELELMRNSREYAITAASLLELAELFRVHGVALKALEDGRPV
jgi:hypothetical protein